MTRKVRGRGSELRGNELEKTLRSHAFCSMMLVVASPCGVLQSSFKRYIHVMLLALEVSILSTLQPHTPQASVLFELCRLWSLRGKQCRPSDAAMAASSASCSKKRSGDTAAVDDDLERAAGADPLKRTACGSTSALGLRPVPEEGLVVLSKAYNSDVTCVIHVLTLTKVALPRPGQWSLVLQRRFRSCRR